MIPSTITIATDAGSWFNDELEALISGLTQRGHKIEVVHDSALIQQSEITFLLSLGQIVPVEVLGRSRHNIVVHASALPAGKGWSPVTWQVLEGVRDIPMSLFEAVDRVDAGPIYLRGSFPVSEVDLVTEIRTKQAQETVRLCLEFVDQYPLVVQSATPQDASGETFYPRRTREDSRLDPHRSIADQFDLIRVCDPDAYPAYFDLKGHRFTIVLERIDE